MARMTTATTDPRLRLWHVQKYKHGWIVVRWKGDGLHETFVIWGGTKFGKPQKIFVSAEEAVAKAKELNQL